MVTDCPPTDLPEDKPEAVDVCRLEAVEAVCVDVVAEDLRSHVAPGADPGVGGDVQPLGVTVVPHRQTKVRYGRRPVILYENISKQTESVAVGHSLFRDTHLDLMSLWAMAGLPLLPNISV